MSQCATALFQSSETMTALFSLWDCSGADKDAAGLSGAGNVEEWSHPSKQSAVVQCTTGDGSQQWKPFLLEWVANCSMVFVWWTHSCECKKPKIMGFAVSTCKWALFHPSAPHALLEQVDCLNVAVVLTGLSWGSLPLIPQARNVFWIGESKLKQNSCGIAWQADGSCAPALASLTEWVSLSLFVLDRARMKEAGPQRHPSSDFFKLLLFCFVGTV